MCVFNEAVRSRAVSVVPNGTFTAFRHKNIFLFRTFFFKENPGILMRFTSVCDVTYQFVMQTPPNLHKSDWSSYDYRKLYMCVTNKWVELKSKIKHVGTWSIAALISCHLCYRPAVFFRHVRLIALLFQAWNIRRISKILLFQFFPPFLNIL